MRPTCLLILTCLTCASCASLYSMKMPSQGGPAWIEHSSDHFRLQTDLEPGEARLMLKELEARRTGLLNAAWHGADFKTRRTRVVVFRNPNELQEFMYRYVVGLWTVDFAGEKMMVLSRGDLAGMRVLTHELTHDLGSSYFARQPHWLGEGMAGFLETLQLDDAHGKVVIGVPDVRMLKDVSSVPYLFERERLGRGPDYKQSWGLVFYLENHEGKAFNEYQKALFRGDDWERAWSEAFPAYATRDGQFDLTKKVNAALHELAYSRGYKTASAPLAAYEGPIDERTMPEPEILALRGEMFLTLPNIGSEDSIRSRAEAEVHAALAQDPGEVYAMAVQLRLLDDPADRLELARKATAARPQDPRAWLLVDEALAEREDEAPLRVAALETAVGLAPDNPRALHRLARAYARAGRASAAEPLARKSLSIYPDSADALDSYGLVMQANGNCKAAIELQTMAVGRLPHFPEEVDLTKSRAGRRLLTRQRTMEERLERYRHGCS